MFEKQARSIKRRYHLLFPRKRVSREGVNYDLDCRELIDYGVFSGGWEPDTQEFIHKHVKDGFVTLEIGANVGAHTLLIAKLSGENGVVHAVEPTEFARTKLLRNLSLNPEIEKRVHVHNLLISDTTADNAELEIRSSWPQKAKMKWNPKERVSSRVSTIDQLVIADCGLTRLDLLKIDIDGFDYRALCGAKATIEKFKPLIYVELCQWALNENGSSVTDILSFLESYGYKGYDANGYVPLNPGNFLDRIGNKGSINGVFYLDGQRLPVS
jgi:FkbM family methyltransferase